MNHSETKLVVMMDSKYSLSTQKSALKHGEFRSGSLGVVKYVSSLAFDVPIVQAWVLHQKKRLATTSGAVVVSSSSFLLLLLFCPSDVGQRDDVSSWHVVAGLLSSSSFYSLTVTDCFGV
jgi:hypothetical protein